MAGMHGRRVLKKMMSLWLFPVVELNHRNYRFHFFKLKENNNNHFVSLNDSLPPSMSKKRKKKVEQ